MSCDQDSARSVSDAVDVPMCAICRDSLTGRGGPTTRTITLDCAHKYHFGCIRQWLNRHLTCPLCRATPCYIPVMIPLRSGRFALGYEEVEIEETDEEDMPPPRIDLDLAMQDLLSYESFDNILESLYRHE